MSARTINQIIIAVKDDAPVTERELRLCLLSLNAMEFHDRRWVQSLVDAIDNNNPAMMKFWSSHVKRELEIRQKSNGMTPDEYLGPNNTPGTPEYNKLVLVSKAIFKKVTGEKL